MHFCLKKLQKSKNLTMKDTENFTTTSLTVKFLKKTIQSFGFAKIADTFISAQKPPKFAPYANTRKHFSHNRLTIINKQIPSKKKAPKFGALNLSVLYFNFKYCLFNLRDITVSNARLMDVIRGKYKKSVGVCFYKVAICFDKLNIFFGIIFNFC